ncbi:MAG TPA: ABC-type transport auxiliary lipoprotein family protein, partial [Polyangiaceae bacterium]|nr:ABC-type transport auxiliary lipoprotein family protein [Polyangiaceae bacterium]
DALSLRYFNPLPRNGGASEPAPQPFELRLGQVSSASNLDERIAYRVSSAEVGFYEDRRWTEPPEAYLRRALEKDLFEERKLTRIITGPAPVLDVELSAFEEQKGAGKVRVKLSFSLRDERRSLLERSIDLDQPLEEQRGADAAERAAQALVDSLSRAVRAVGDDVVKKLGAKT